MSDLALDTRILSQAQRSGIARQLAASGEPSDLLIAAYYLRLDGDAVASAVHLARAGQPAQALDQPPGEATR